MNLYLETLLEFYDIWHGCDDECNAPDFPAKCQRPFCSQKSSNSLNAIIGEEIGLALLQNFIGKKFSYLNRQCLEMLENGGFGRHLDAWIGVSISGVEILFQSEIKNWNVHSLNGRQLAIDAPPDESAAYRRERWHNQFEDCGDGTYFPKEDNISKVLRQTQKPFDVAGREIRPIIIFWEAMHPRGKQKALFSVTLPRDASCRIKNFDGFKKLWVFSMSNHVRNLLKEHKKKIVVEDDDPIMLWPRRRLNWLNKIIST